MQPLPGTWRIDSGSTTPPLTAPDVQAETQAATVDAVDTASATQAPATPLVTQDTLSLVALAKRYGDTPVFDNVTLRVKPGEFVAVVGESGVGKSTLLNCMAGLDTWDSGKVTLAGQDLGTLDDTARALLRRASVGFVFQAFHVLPHLDVAQNIALPLMLLHDAQSQHNDHSGILPMTETGALNAARLGATANPLATHTSAAKRWLLALQRAWAERKHSGWATDWALDPRVTEILAAVGLKGLGSRLPQQLSGGQLQRVAIARALVHRPALVLADEPTGNLDPDTAAKVMGLLSAQAREHGTSVVLVTHSQAAAARADRVCALRANGITDLETASPG